MSVSIFAYSDKGCILAKKISRLFDDSECFSIEKFATAHGMTSVKSTKEKVGEVFLRSQVLIFIGAVGIAVRSIAPCIQDKTTDPAVIVIDECANFTIPILSGHIGGANSIAKDIAKKIGSVLVVSTATDINNRFSVDDWATKNKFAISSMDIAKEVSATILLQDIAIKSDFAIRTELAKGLLLADDGADTADIGIYLTHTLIKPFTTTLRLVPKCLVLGIGCRKGTKMHDIEDAVRKTLHENTIDIAAIEKITSIDLKRHEDGLLEFAKNYTMPIEFYSAEQLNAVDGDFTQSNFVKSITGVDNVCERSACLGACSTNILIHKTVKNSVTIALALKKLEVSFTND